MISYKTAYKNFWNYTKNFPLIEFFFNICKLQIYTNLNSTPQNLDYIKIYKLKNIRMLQQQIQIFPSELYNLISV